MRQIDFNVSAADYLAVQTHIVRSICDEIKNRQNSWGAKVKGFIMGIIPFIIFVLPLMLFVGNNPASINIYVGYLFAILFLLQFVGKKVNQKRYLSFLDSQLCKEGLTSIIVGEHGIEDQDERSHTIYKWQGIVSIDQWQDYILFRSPLYKGIFIPVRAFASPEEMNLFLNEARIHMSNASKRTTSPDTE